MKQRVIFDKLSERVFVAKNHSFMIVGRQPDLPPWLVVYFIIVYSKEEIGTPLVPIEACCLQKEIESCQYTTKRWLTQDVLNEQLDVYYENVPEAGAAYFTRPISEIIEIAKKIKPDISLAMIPIKKNAPSQFCSF